MRFDDNLFSQVELLTPGKTRYRLLINDGELVQSFDIYSQLLELRKPCPHLARSRTSQISIR